MSPPPNNIQHPSISGLGKDNTAPQYTEYKSSDGTRSFCVKSKPSRRVKGGTTASQNYIKVLCYHFGCVMIQFDSCSAKRPVLCLGPSPQQCTQSEPLATLSLTTTIVNDEPKLSWEPILPRNAKQNNPPPSLPIPYYTNSLIAAITSILTCFNGSETFITLFDITMRDLLKGEERKIFCIGEDGHCPDLDKYLNTISTPTEEIYDSCVSSHNEHYQYDHAALLRYLFEKTADRQHVRRI